MEVLQDPLTWSSLKKQELLRDAIEVANPPLAASLTQLKLQDIVVQDDGWVTHTRGWNHLIHRQIIDHMREFRKERGHRKYDFRSVRSLLQFIRNVCIHYKKIPRQVRVLFGVNQRQDLFDGYFSIRFPNLFLKVYQLVGEHCKEEEDFKEYFTQGF